MVVLLLFAQHDGDANMAALSAEDSMISQSCLDLTIEKDM